MLSAVLGIALGACAAGPGPGNRALATDGPVAETTTGSYLAGRHAIRERDISRASQYFDAVLAKDPANTALQRRAFLLRVQDGRIDEALALAPGLQDQLEQGAPVANLVLALQAARSGQFESALTQLDALPDSRMNQILVPLLGAWAAFGSGDLADAESRLSRLGGVAGFDSLQELHAALMAESAGNVEEARRRYDLALADLAAAPLRLRLAGALFLARQGDLDAGLALVAVDTGDTADPDAVSERVRQAGQPGGPAPLTAIEGMAEGLFDLASALQRDRGSDSALLFARLAVWLKPEFDLANLLIAEVLDDRGRHAQALAIYDRISPSSPYRLMATLRAASSLRDLDRIDDAIARLEALADRRTDLAVPLVRLGDLHREREAWDAAIEAYDRAIERVGTLGLGQWSLLYTRGIALERAGQWSRAEADFLAALDLSPDQPYVLNYLGYSWVDRGENLDRAKAMIEKAVRLRPNDGYIVDSLGWALYRLGSFSSAVVHLERAVELRPTDPTINDHLGDAYWRVGRHEEARFQWRRALAFDPEPDLSAALERKLRLGLPEASKADRSDLGGDGKFG